MFCRCNFILVISKKQYSILQGIVHTLVKLKYAHMYGGEKKQTKSKPPKKIIPKTTTEDNKAECLNSEHTFKNESTEELNDIMNNFFLSFYFFHRLKLVTLLSISSPIDTL